MSLQDKYHAEIAALLNPAAKELRAASATATTASKEAAQHMLAVEQALGVLVAAVTTAREHSRSTLVPAHTAAAEKVTEFGDKVATAFSKTENHAALANLAALSAGAANLITDQQRGLARVVMGYDQNLGKIEQAVQGLSATPNGMVPPTLALISPAAQEYGKLNGIAEQADAQTSGYITSS